VYFGGRLTFRALVYCQKRCALEEQKSETRIPPNSTIREHAINRLLDTWIPLAFYSNVNHSHPRLTTIPPIFNTITAQLIYD